MSTNSEQLEQPESTLVAVADQPSAEQQQMLGQAMQPVRRPELWVRTANYYGPDRRSAPVDRRKLSFFSLRQLSTKAERKGHRRAEDKRTPYVDWYEPKLMFFVVGVIVLACIDAFLTLELWQRGEIELNFLMAQLISNDVQSYVNFKILLTALALFLLVIYKNFPVYRYFRVYQLIYLLFGFFCLLVLSEWQTLRALS